MEIDDPKRRDYHLTNCLWKDTIQEKREPSDFTNSLISGDRESFLLWYNLMSWVDQPAVDNCVNNCKWKKWKTASTITFGNNCSQSPDGLRHYHCWHSTLWCETRSEKGKVRGKKVRHVTIPWVGSADWQQKAECHYGKQSRKWMGQRDPDVDAHLLGPWLGPQLQLVPGLVALPGLAQV